MIDNPPHRVGGPTNPVDTVVRGACPHDCPDTCALLTTVHNGVALRVQGNPAHAPIEVEPGQDFAIEGVYCGLVRRG